MYYVCVFCVYYECVCVTVVCSVCEGGRVQVILHIHYHVIDSLCNLVPSPTPSFSLLEATKSWASDWERGYSLCEYTFEPSACYFVIYLSHSHACAPTHTLTHLHSNAHAPLTPTHPHTLTQLIHHTHCPWTQFHMEHPFRPPPEDQPRPLAPQEFPRVWTPQRYHGEVQRPPGARADCAGLQVNECSCC